MSLIKDSSYSLTRSAGLYYICAVYTSFQLLRKYIRYYRTAYNGKGHGMHSPFVFDFIIHVLNDKNNYADYQQIEQVRRLLLTDDREVEVLDMGAGSTRNNQVKRRVSSIAKHAAKPAKFGQLFYRMVRYYKPGNILELGTSLGITSRYLAMGRPESRLITIEGAPRIAALAETALRNEGISNVDIRTGNFDHELPAVLEGFRPDLVFVDGNHRKEPTISYFEQLLRVSSNDTMLIFDDIHWSEGMEEAWEYISNHPSVRCTIDLFFVGIVLFRQEFREKQNFKIRF
jgi:predicted O-methyltransferase YrrM